MSVILALLQQLASIGNNLTIQIVAGQSMKVCTCNSPSPPSIIVRLQPVHADNAN